MTLDTKQLKVPGGVEGAVLAVGASEEVITSAFTGVNDQAVCKGWVNFDGTGTITIRDSFNVSSLTDNGTGDYDVNWDIDFDNTDYSVSAISNREITQRNGLTVGAFNVTTKNSSFALTDATSVYVQAFGDMSNLSVGGSAPGVKIDSLCKGWVNFNGTGAIVIRGSFNVSSLTDNGTGDYDVNWDIDFDNTDYAPNATAATGECAISTLAIGSCQVLALNSGGTLIDTNNVIVQAFGDNPIALSTEVSLLTRWTDVTTFTATPDSTSVLLMTVTSAFKIGIPIRFTESGGTFYAQVTAISANTSITIRGAPFNNDVITLAVGLPETLTWVILDVPGNYADAADTDLNDGNDGKKMFWEGSRAFCMGFDTLHSLADTGAAQPRVNLRLGGESISVSSTSSSNGPLMSTAQTVVSTVVDINTPNYEINRGDKITCTTDGLGTNDDAEGLEMHAIFVLE